LVLSTRFTQCRRIRRSRKNINHRAMPAWHSVGLKRMASSWSKLGQGSSMAYCEQRTSISMGNVSRWGVQQGREGGFGILPSIYVSACSERASILNDSGGKRRWHGGGLRKGGVGEASSMFSHCRAREGTSAERQWLILRISGLTPHLFVNGNTGGFLVRGSKKP